MNFDLNEDQRLTRDMIERFLGPINIQGRLEMRRLPAHYDPARWQQLADLGLLAMSAPTAMEGMESSLLDLALTAEALGKGLSPDPWLENGVFPLRLAAAIGDANVARSLISAEKTAAIAFAEPAQGYARTASDVRADNGQISGQKQFVLGEAISSLLFVTLANDHVAIIRSDDPAISRQRYPIIDGSLAANLQFDGCLADIRPFSANRWAQLVAEMQLLASAEMVGLAQTMFDHTLDYVRERRQFGVSIGSFQALQHRLVECYAALEQARSMMLRTAMHDQAQHGDNWQRSAAGCKAFVGAAAIRIGLEAVQMHGGMGQTDELAIGHALKRVMLLDKYLGDQQHGLTSFARAA